MGGWSPEPFEARASTPLSAGNQLKTQNKFSANTQESLNNILVRPMGQLISDKSITTKIILVISVEMKKKDQLNSISEASLTQ